MRDHFIAELSSQAENNKNLILITGDLGFGVLTAFEKQFPSQYINAGVAEQNMTGLATGLALSGKTVFTYSIGNFNTLRCLEQIRNDACYHNANVNIISVGGGFSYGQLGFSHHATEDLAILRAIPNIRVFSPCDLFETIELTKALCKIGGVNYLRLDKSLTQAESKPKFELGKARTLKEGVDLTIFGTGGIVQEALDAAFELQKTNISVRVVSMHSIKPLDKEAILLAAKETNGILTIEEHTIDGGLGGAIAETILEAGLNPGFFYRFGLRSDFATSVGDQNYLRKVYGLNKDSIIKKIKDLLQ